MSESNQAAELEQRIVELERAAAATIDRVLRNARTYVAAASNPH